MQASNRELLEKILVALEKLDTKVDTLINKQNNPYYPWVYPWVYTELPNQVLPHCVEVTDSVYSIQHSFTSNN